MAPRHSPILAILTLPCLLCPRPARAHRDDYINETVVYLTLGQKELETEYWYDRGFPSGGGADFNRHNAAVEFGITNHWMVDGRVTAVSDYDTRFDSGRFETRYRFFDEGDRPVDTAVSLEVNSERASDGSNHAGIEPRLILSKDFAEKGNLTVNAAEEIPLNSGTAAFLGAFGARYNWTELVRVGSELQYNFEENLGAVIPQVWLAFSERVTLKLGYSVGFDQQPYDFARTALEVEF